MARMLGIPALKLWHDIVSRPGTQKSGSRSARVLFMMEHVRFFPELNLKTGRDSSVFPAWICFSLRFFSALTGQQSYPGNSNKSTFSPPGIPDLGFFRCKRRELGEEQRTSCHRRSEAGENDFSADAKISPMRTEPKNPVVAAAQITCLSRAGQLVAAILLPRVSKRGNVIALLVLGWEMKLSLECSAPLRRSLDNLSSVRWVQSNPLRVCTNFRADRYV
jgi:hypothetical protein